QTPTEKYAASVSQLDKLLQKGLLTQEVYSRAVEKAKADMNAATQATDEMRSSSSLLQRTINATAETVQKLGDGVSSAAEGGSALLKFAKDAGVLLVALKVVTGVKTGNTFTDMAKSAFGAFVGLRGLANAAKLVGVYLGVSGGALGTFASAALGLSNPLIGGALLALNFGRAMLDAKEKALEMAKALNEGKTSIEDLNAELGQVNAQHVDDLAFAMQEAEESSKRSEAAFASFGDAFVHPFVEGFAAIYSGFAGLNAGVASLMEGITSIAVPIGQALAPFATLIGTAIEGVLKLIGVLAQLLGSVLKVAGATIHTLLSPVIVGFNNFADTIRAAMNSAFASVTPVFEYIDFADTIRAAMNSAFASVTPVFEYIDKKIQGFYEFMSRIPVIGKAFASGETEGNNAAASGPAAAATATAEAAAMVDEEMQLVNAAIAQQEKQLSDAINKSAEYGQAGFDAALAYQTELRRLNEQLQAGMINEQTYAQAAGEARKQFDEQTKAIEARNKAAAEQAEEDRKAEQSQQRAVTKQTDAFFSATEQAAKFGEAGVAAARQYESGLVS
ncbi:hypothetical protein EBZ39_16595, partial [bacterium]|nr:hypothetical protein [bacterium]